MSSPPLTGTNHSLPFDRLSPADFERLALYLLKREGFKDIEHLGASGSEQGRDLEAKKDGRRIIAQCKRVQHFGPTDALRAISTIPQARKDNSDLLFIVACSVSAATRKSARQAWISGNCDFWAGTELDERVKSHPDILQEFFHLPAGMNATFPAYLNAVAEYCGRITYLSLPAQPLPTLAEIYVPQQVESLRNRQRHPAEELLGMTENALIQGVPGIGKSSLLQRHAFKLATDPIAPSQSSPYLAPVLVHARLLADQKGSFSEALLSAVTSELGFLLQSPLPQGFFAEKPAQNALWIILLDGLDEITSSRKRDLLLSNLLTHVRRPGSIYRLLATARPSPEISLLYTAFHAFELQAFSLDSTEEFARRWFENRPSTNKSDKDQFLDRVRRSRIQDLSRIPLLLSMAAVIYEKDRGSELPTRRAGLYRSFVNVLLEDEEENRGTRHQFRDEWDLRLGTDGLRSADLLFNLRFPLVQHLAWVEQGEQTGNSTDLISEAANFASAQTSILPHSVGTEWMRRQIGTLLLRTGLIVRRASREEFFHTTFREYACALKIAQQAHPLSSSWMTEISALGDLSSTKEVILFLLSTWSDQGLDCSAPIESLLNEGREGLLVAGAALTDDVVVSRELGERMVSKLAQDVASLKSDFVSVLNPFSSVSLLGKIRGPYSIRPELEKLSRTGEVAGIVLLGVGLALEHQDDRESAKAIYSRLVVEGGDAALFALHQLKSNELVSVLQNRDAEGVYRMLAASEAIKSNLKKEVIQVARDRSFDLDGRKAAIAALSLAHCFDELVTLSHDPQLTKDLSLYMAECLEKGAHVQILTSLILDPRTVTALRQASGIALYRLGKSQELRSLAFNPKIDREVAQFLAIMVGESNPSVIRGLGQAARPQIRKAPKGKRRPKK